MSKGKCYRASNFLQGLNVYARRTGVDDSRRQLQESPFELGAHEAARVSGDVTGPRADITSSKILFDATGAQAIGRLPRSRRGYT